MRILRRRFTYANVVATIALFLAVTGGVVWAGSKISGTTIKKNSLPGNRLKKKSVTSKQIKPNTLQSSNFAAGAPGTLVVDATAAAIPGATTPPPTVTPVTLSGTAAFTPSKKARRASVSFTPVNGHAYSLLGELKGNPIDGDGAGGPNSCSPFVQILNNGIPILGLSIDQDLSIAPPGTATRPVDWNINSIGLSDKGTAQTLTARVFGDPGCGAGTTLDSLRLTVVSAG